jgi:hypothetical protein
VILGPFALILRRSGGGWESVAMYQSPKRPGLARTRGWSRQRADAIRNLACAWGRDRK